MSPLFYVVFALLVVIAFGLVAILRVASWSDTVIARGGAMPLPTARQRRHWKRERLKFNPRLGVRW